MTTMNSLGDFKMKNKKARYCPTCGTRCEPIGTCPLHGKIILGPPIRVCLNGHIAEVLR